MSEAKPMNVDFRTKTATTAMKAVHLLNAPDYLDSLERDEKIKGSAWEGVIPAGTSYKVDVENNRQPIDISTEGPVKAWMRRSKSDKRVLCITDPSTNLYAEISEGTNNIRVLSRTTKKQISVSIMPSKEIEGSYFIGEIDGQDISSEEDTSVEV